MFTFSFINEYDDNVIYINNFPQINLEKYPLDCNGGYTLYHRR